MAASVASAVGGECSSAAWGTNSVCDRSYGLLIGSFIGDAAGGPVEFAAPDLVSDVLPNTRQWGQEQRLTADSLEQLATTFPLLSYVTLRGDSAPYGPWKSQAPAGTVTDDSRMKIITVRALRKLQGSGRSLTELQPEHLAEEILAFRPRLGATPSAGLQALLDEGLHEYRLASRWLLGSRDEDQALPVERLWGGVANCSGQMFLPPLAVIYAGRPDEAYRATYRVDFVDAPSARDFCAALNAGLAAALSPELNSAAPDVRWQALLSAMRDTDPFRYRDIPYVGRPLHRWLDLAHRMARQAQGKPAVLFRALEDHGQPVYWWDAHFTLLVPLALLHLCQFNALAALHLCLDFGHDTDSYAQVLGAMAGAVHGANLFPESMRDTVRQTVREDYGEDVDRWPDLLCDRVHQK